MSRTPHSLHCLRQPAIALLTVNLVLLCGCANMTMISSAGSSFNDSGTFLGTVHGGQQPVYNATVELFAAGSTGYGSAATLLATTTSDVNGNFSFTKNPGYGVSSGHASTWQCPAASPDPQIYITAVGGNTQGTGVPTTNNSASALLAAIGPCSAVSTSTQVGLNEISTVATVFALAQYINPGTTPGTESIGSNGADTTTGTPQGAVGLNNAVATVQNLANISTGQPVSSLNYPGIANSVAGVTITATPESSKLILIADILAACINTPASNSNNCADLFASASPPAVSSITSQPSAIFATAQDTIQAAYYMAVNPTNAGTFLSCNSSATTKIGCLFGLASSSPPFQTSLAVQPLDWTIGVTYTSTGNCTGGGAFFQEPNKEAVDVSGNLWFVNGSAIAPANLGELSPTGTPLFCGAPSTTAVSGRGVTVDPTGNVFASWDAFGVMEVPAGSSSTVNWPLLALGGITPTPLDIVADGNGDIFYTSGSHLTPTIGGILYEYPSVGASTPFPPTMVLSGMGGSVGSFALGYAAADSGGRIWMSSQTAATGSNYYVFSGVPASAAITGYSIGSSNSVTFCTSTAPTFTAGQNVVVTGLTTGTSLNQLGYTVNSVSLNGPCTTNSFTGTEVQSVVLTSSGGALVADSGTATDYTFTSQNFTAYPFGAAIDSAGYFYAGDGCCSSGNAKEMLRTPSSNLGIAHSAAYLGGNNGMHAVAIDGASNQWFGSIFPMSGTTYGIGESYWTGSVFSALSPTGTTPGSCDSTNGCATNGGFQKASFLEPGDIAVDPSGNVWVPATGLAKPGSAQVIQYIAASSNITEVVGAAVPVVTPLSLGAKNSTLGTKP